jgi:hypothetical protein
MIAVALYATRGTGGRGRAIDAAVTVPVAQPPVDAAADSAPPVDAFIPPDSPVDAGMIKKRHGTGTSKPTGHDTPPNDTDFDRGN